MVFYSLWFRLCSSCRNSLIKSFIVAKLADYTTANKAIEIDQSNHSLHSSLCNFFFSFMLFKHRSMIISAHPLYLDDSHWTLSGRKRYLELFQLFAWKLWNSWRIVEVAEAVHAIFTIIAFGLMEFAKKNFQLQQIAWNKMTKFHQLELYDANQSVTSNCGFSAKKYHLCASIVMF